MDKNYYNSLVQAKECEEEDIKILEKLNNENLNRIIKFINYSKSKDAFRYTNALDVLNMNEDGISELLAWLIDHSKNDGLDNIIQNIKKDFCKEFFNKIGLKISIDNDITCNLREPTDTSKKPDIIIKSGDDVKCIIEVKKNAKLSCTKGKYNKIYTQLEHYKEYYCNEPKYIFIVDATSGYLDSNIENHIKKGTELKTGIKNVRDLLNELSYEPIEHDAVALILYNALKKYAENRFENGILKATNYNDFIEAIKIISGWCSIENKDIIIRFCEDKQNECIEKNQENNIEITYRKSYKNNELNQYNLYSNKENRLNKFTIPFHQKMNELKKDEIINILCQYVEYWELATCEHHHLNGNTKIIDGKYIYNVCKAIKEDNKLLETQILINTMLE